MSEVLGIGLSGADGPLPEAMGLVDVRDGVADGATFRGKAAEAGGLIVRYELGQLLQLAKMYHTNELISSRLADWLSRTRGRPQTDDVDAVQVTVAVS